MSQLAKKATDNGDAVSYTYGAIPNDPATWDHDKVQGCYCSEGFEGYDCSLLSCPYGDDPITKLGQFNEVQQIFCQETTTDGSFTLSFRQQKTTSLSYNSKVADVKAALESLSTLYAVSVYLDDENADATTTPVCSVSGTTWHIEFLSPTGDVPNVKATTDAIEAFTITERTKGNKEWIECSGRGLCDHETGLCECAAGFASSNGRGEPGLRNDCGYKTPITVVQQ
jgi:hypothetical protein